TVWPGLWASITLESAPAVAVAFPSTAVITSPLSIPAFVAALCGSTAATTTPGVPFGVVVTEPEAEGAAKGVARAVGFGAVDDLDASGRLSPRRRGCRTGSGLID